MTVASKVVKIDSICQNSWHTPYCNIIHSIIFTFQYSLLIMLSVLVRTFLLYYRVLWIAIKGNRPRPPRKICRSINGWHVFLLDVIPSRRERVFQHWASTCRFQDEPDGLRQRKRPQLRHRWQDRHNLFRMKKQLNFCGPEFVFAIIWVILKKNHLAANLILKGIWVRAGVRWPPEGLGKGTLKWLG